MVMCVCVVSWVCVLTAFTWAFCTSCKNAGTYRYRCYTIGEWTCSCVIWQFADGKCVEKHTFVLALCSEINRNDSMCAVIPMLTKVKTLLQWICPWKGNNWGRWGPFMASILIFFYKLDLRVYINLDICDFRKASWKWNFPLTKLILTSPLKQKFQCSNWPCIFTRIC